ncbi:MAG: hypothetical protein FWH17_09480 [Oscillospiraceae bacterium]|nr:hypothetical protein [Oscillospiraceae bacterium]
MAQNRQLTGEEICAKLNEMGGTFKAEKAVELSDEQLETVSGGVGAFAFEDDDGTVSLLVCSNKKTTNELFQQCLQHKMTCNYASPGARSCASCVYLSGWLTDAEVK